MKTKIIELDEFTRAYVECALWSSTDNADSSGGEPLDSNYSVEDIHPDSLQQMIKDCQAFQQRNAKVLESIDDDFKAGHDFWLTRNGHGCGFWDGDYSEDIGELLTNDSKAQGECNLYVGDNGQVHTGG